METRKEQAPVSSEVRFAVVMYGGVSLAVYMNGIAQELLRMVHSTAVKKDTKNDGIPLTNILELKRSARVYRKLSYILAGADPKNAEDYMKNNESIHTRFLVDIISGSSAGGINGIFLAKALANGENMETLKDLWVQEGDFSLLLNDKESLERPLSLQKPPVSLLNSMRMYLKLLNALDEMDGKDSQHASGTAKKKGEPYVEELDLFVTATDINGLTLPITLANGVVYERRHRNVFHFIYTGNPAGGSQDNRNDFSDDYNPFLAYAARCTSAFPFAFEPMRLCDIDELLAKIPAYCKEKRYGSESPLWKIFYKDYLSDGTTSGTIAFPRRAFGDGGYLDNRPFSYATETMARKRSDVPVDRKLIYIEPSPEHPENDIEEDRKPNALENTMAALFKLPRYETIREDLERVIERNRTIERVNHIVEGAEEDRGSFLSKEESLSDSAWAEKDLAFMVRKKGAGYSAYHRLELASATDDLAELVTRVAGYDERSDYFIIIRSFIREWRKQRFTERADRTREKETTNLFLHRFGLLYPLRRLNFVMHRIDQLYRLDAKSKKLMGLHCGGFWPEGTESLPVSKAKEFRDELVKIKTTLNEAYSRLRSTIRLLRSRWVPETVTATAGIKGATPPSPLYTGVQSILGSILRALLEESQQKRRGDGESSLILEYFLGSDRKNIVASHDNEREINISDTVIAGCEGRARRFLEEHPQIVALFDKIGDELSAPWSQAREEVDDLCKKALDLSPEDFDHAKGAHGARACLKTYYEDYDDYDMIIFPIIYGTNIGELDVAEIVRISPEDAPSLIDERKNGYSKLAGTSLAHFGAFLEERWRKNDILWGRLDGAECLIKTLLPEKPSLAEELIREAHSAIILETIEGMSTEGVNDLLVESVMRPNTTKSSGLKPEHVLEQLVKNLVEKTVDPEVKKRLGERITAQNLIDHYNMVYKINSHLEARKTMENAARAATVVGGVLSGISKEYNKSEQLGRWIARFGMVFWGLVEMAVPHSIFNLLFRHWIKLLYLVETILIVGGTLSANIYIQKFGLLAFAVTLAVHIIVFLLHDTMQSRKGWLTALKTLAILFFILLALLGVFFVLAVTGSMDTLWTGVCKIQSWFVDGGLSRWPAKSGIIAFFLAFLLWNARDDLMALIRRACGKRKGQAKPGKNRKRGGNLYIGFQK